MAAPQAPYLPHPRRRLPRLRGVGAGLESLGAAHGVYPVGPIIGRHGYRHHAPTIPDPVDYTPAPARLASSLAVAAEKALAVSLLVNLT